MDDYDTLKFSIPLVYVFAALMLMTHYFNTTSQATNLEKAESLRYSAIAVENTARYTTIVQKVNSSNKENISKLRDSL